MIHLPLALLILSPSLLSGGVSFFVGRRLALKRAASENQNPSAHSIKNLYVIEDGAGKLSIRAELKDGTMKNWKCDKVGTV